MPPLLAAAPEVPAGTAPLPPAVAEAVGIQLGKVPLEGWLDPLALSSRCRDTVEVRRHCGLAGRVIISCWVVCCSCTGGYAGDCAHLTVPFLLLSLDVMQMLVRESVPLPKPQMPAAQPAAAPSAPVPAAPTAAAAAPVAPLETAAEPQQQPAAGGRRQAAGGAAGGAARASGGGGRGKLAGGKGGPKGTLDFRRSTRR